MKPIATTYKGVPYSFTDKMNLFLYNKEAWESNVYKLDGAKSIIGKMFTACEQHIKNKNKHLIANEIASTTFNKYVSVFHSHGVFDLMDAVKWISKLIERHHPEVLPYMHNAFAIYYGYVKVFNYNIAALEAERSSSKPHIAHNEGKIK